MKEHESRGNGCLMTLGEYLTVTGTAIAILSFITGMVDSRLSGAVPPAAIGGVVGAVVGAITWFAGSRINIKADSW